jgi:predicted nucleotidyltransferase
MSARRDIELSPELTTKLAQAVSTLRRVANPTRIILFGSHARGNADPGSDVDIMIVEPEVANRFEETVRLSRALRPLRMPVDLIVIGEEPFRERATIPGTVYFEAATQGRVMYEAA